MRSALLLGASSESTLAARAAVCGGGDAASSCPPCSRAEPPRLTPGHRAPPAGSTARAARPRRPSPSLHHGSATLMDEGAGSSGHTCSHHAIISAYMVLDRMLQWRHDVWSSVAKVEAGLAYLLTAATSSTILYIPVLSLSCP